MKVIMKTTSYIGCDINRPRPGHINKFTRILMSPCDDLFIKGTIMQI